jgi:hypothetical protein
MSRIAAVILIIHSHNIMDLTNVIAFVSKPLGWRRRQKLALSIGLNGVDST